MSVVRRRPLVFAHNGDAWGSTQPIKLITGLLYGDLHTGNLIIYADSANTITGVYMNDFALFKEEMPPLYVQRYLEMSDLLLALSHVSFAPYLDFMLQLAEADIPEPSAGASRDGRTVRQLAGNVVAKMDQDDRPAKHR